LKTDAKKAPGCGERIAACAVPASRSTHAGSIWTDAVKMAICGVRQTMKRIADWLEKISAGSILIGLFQNNMWAIAIGLGTLAGSVYISRRFL